MPATVFTIGHSNHSPERFLALLRLHSITALGDVRSHPYSRKYPQFNREELKEFLRSYDIHYVFLGKELGARSEDPACYERGKISYTRLAQTKLFQQGLDRVQSGSREHRLALMCAEKEPLDCHRTILVARHLAARGIEIQHIVADGALESHLNVLLRLADSLHLRANELHLFCSQEDVLAEAYTLQEQRIAYEPAATYGSNDSLSGAAS
jgi:uncharacterized protein (DUF488 family)